MKKIYGHIIMMTMATLIAAACSHDSDIVPENGGDVPVVEQGSPIAFMASQNENQAVTRAEGPEQAVTRAEGLAGQGITAFQVYGFKNTGMEGTDDYTTYQTVFPGYTVKWVDNSAASSTTNSHGWEYVAQQLLGQDEQTVKYWDWSAKAYRFFGVTKSYDKLEGEVLNGQFKVSFKIDLTTDAGIEAVPYYSHLWFSNNNYEAYPTRPYGRAVELVFLKPVCKVRFMFIYEDPTQHDRIKTPLENIGFHRSDDVTIKQKGSVTITYPLTGTGTTETCTFDTEASGIVGFTRDYTEEDPFWYTVLPITDQDSYTLDVIVDGEPKSAVVPAEFMDWLPGYEYTYIFKIHVDGSVTINAVQSAFTGWNIQESTYNVYNW